MQRILSSNLSPNLNESHDIPLHFLQEHCRANVQHVHKVGCMLELEDHCMQSAALESEASMPSLLTCHFLLLTS